VLRGLQADFESLGGFRQAAQPLLELFEAGEGIVNGEGLAADGAVIITMTTSCF
jgi:hypothetical protein